MASGSQDRQKGIEDLEKEVTCPICQGLFQEPKILPCLHYYCKTCIQKLALRVGASQPFPCPECRTATLLPQDDPDQLPTAFFINRMKDVHAKLETIEGKVEAKCEMCSGGVATAFCRHCVDFICAECVKSHERLKVFSGHEVSNLDDLKEGGARHIIPKLSPPPICNLHEEQAKLYCFDCNILICRDCIVKDHKEHNYEFVKKVASEIKEELCEQMVPLSEIHAGITSAIKNNEETKSEIVTMNESMTTTVKQSFQELRDILDKQEEELLTEIDTVVKQKTHWLNVQQKDLETCSGTIQSLVDFVEKSIEQARDEELITIHRQMMNRITEETKRRQMQGAALHPLEEADMEVVVDCVGSLKKLCKLGAKIITKSAYIAVENTTAVVGRNSLLDFQITTHDGQPLKRLHKVKAILISKVDGSKINAEVISRQQNRYQIEFTTQVRGRHQLRVTYNDVSVLPGPVQIFVNISPPLIGKRVKTIDVGKKVKFITFNSSQEFLVTTDKEIIMFDKCGKKLSSITAKASEIFRGIAVDGADNIYVTDINNHCLMKFDKKGKLLKTAGQKGSGERALNVPYGITLVDDHLFVCDHFNHRLQVLNLDLMFVRQIGLEGGGSGQFKGPFDVKHDEEGNLYVTDFGNHRVQVFNTQGTFLYFLATDGDIADSTGVGISGDLVCISQLKENGQIFLYHKEGHKICSFTCDSGSSGVYGIAVDQDGFIYVCNVDRNVIAVF